MKWAVCVVAMCATAAAQGISIPAGFAKHAGGGDAYKITPGAKIQVYAKGEVTLTTILLEFETIPHDDDAVERFDRDLVVKTTVDHHVSDSRTLASYPILAESFDENGNVRTYHRKLYALDENDVGHLWWTVCHGPAISIGACEAAQRTMKLDMPAPPTLPPPSAAAPRVPAGEPWSFVLPLGFQEVSVDESHTARLRALPDIERVDIRAYKQDKPLEVLTLMVLVTDGHGRASWEALEHSDRLFVAAKSAGERRSTRREHVGNYLVTDSVGTNSNQLPTEKRAIYGVDAHGKIFMFSLECIAKIQPSACHQVFDTMVLDIPDVITPPERTSAFRGDGVTGALVFFGLLALVAIGVAIWIFSAEIRDNKRRRAASATVAA